MCDLSLTQNESKIKRFLNRIDNNILLEKANAQPWNEISEIGDIHEAVDKFTSTILEMLDDHAPLRPILQGKQNQPWFYKV